MLAIAFVLLVTAGPAPAPASPQVTLGLFGGLENGLLGRVATADRRYSVELLQLVWPARQLSLLSDLSLAVRTRSSPGFVGARLGYQLAILHYGEAAPGADVSHTIDVGVVFGAGSARSFVAVEAGVEQVWRAHEFACCDSGVDAFSTGARVMLAAELGLGPRFSLLARAGLRTADHLLEIHVEPWLLAGVAVSF